MRFLISLSGAKCFSKLDAKDGFWSIHLDEKSSYLTTFNMHHGRYHVSCIYPSWSEDITGHLSGMQMDQATDHLPSIITIHDDIYIFWPYPWGAWLAPLAPKGDHHGTWHHLQQCQVLDQAASDSLLWCSVHCPGHVAGPLQNPSPPHTQLPGKAAVLPRTDSITYIHSYPVYQPKQCSYMNSLLSWTGTHQQMQPSSASKPGSSRPSSVLPWHIMTGPSLL